MVHKCIIKEVWYEYEYQMPPFPCTGSGLNTGKQLTKITACPGPRLNGTELTRIHGNNVTNTRALVCVQEHKKLQQAYKDTRHQGQQVQHQQWQQRQQQGQLSQPEQDQESFHPGQLPPSFSHPPIPSQPPSSDSSQQSATPPSATSSSSSCDSSSHHHSGTCN